MKFCNFLAIGLTASLLAGNAQATVVYSMVDDFSSSTNSQTSVWSYRYSDDHLRDGSYSLLPVYSPTNIYFPQSTSYWHKNTNASVTLPGIGVNRTGSSIPYHAGFPNYFPWPDDTVWLHPSATGMAVVSWYTGVDVRIDIDFLFSDIDTKDGGDDGIKWFIDRNITNLAQGVLGKGLSSGSSLHAIDLMAGEYIHFIVDSGSNYLSDSTVVTADIKATPIPAPGSLLLIAGGLLGWFSFKCGRRAIHNQSSPIPITDES